DVLFVMTQPAHPVPGPQSYNKGTTSEPCRKWLHDIPFAVRRPAHPLCASVSSSACSTSTSSNLSRSNIEFSLSLKRSNEMSERSCSFVLALLEFFGDGLKGFLSLAPNRHRYEACNRRRAP